MKRLGPTLWMTWTLLALPAPLLALEEEREAEVRAAVAAFSRAFLAADVAALEELLAEDYLHVNGRSGSVLGRREWLDWMAGRRAEIERRNLVIETYRVEGVEVRLHGGTAVVTGTVHSKGIRSGAPFAVGVRFTNVWISDGGRWRRLAFHDSPLREAEE